MSKVQRLGVLTGGGDAPGLNAVIRAVVRTAERQHGVETVGIHDGYQGLIEKRFRRLRSADVRDILGWGGTILGTSNRHNPFAYPDDDAATVSDRSRECVANARAAGIDGLVVIGGDGTLAISHQLSQLGIPVVGVPKTIDNDLAATDYTFGFWTAIGVATDALDRLQDTAEAHHRVMLLEVMGRNAGWIALHAGLAGSADVILIPEIPYRAVAVARKIEERRQRGQKFSLIVVAEGAVEEGGGVSVRGVDPVTGYPRLGGAAEKLARALESLDPPDRVEHEIRVTVLGHVQRGGSPVPFDRILATRLGERAASLAVGGNWGRMVGLRGMEIYDVALVDAVGGTRRVEPTNSLVLVARSVGTGFGDES
jgi:6-phosphofructokinase 1